MSRVPITKTPKCYVGGAFVRSESGCTYPLQDGGTFFAHIPQCTRKDVRNAVEAAAQATVIWSVRTGYNRGQILYRFAEMIEARADEMADAVRIGSKAGQDPRAEVAAAVDRIVYYAGWSDKYEQLLGNVNPVAAPFFNFTRTEPVGIVGVLAPEEAPLLALVSFILPAIVSGSSVVALASSSRPYPAILLGEMLATSDLPGGVVNLLTGFRRDLMPVFASHEAIRLVAGVAAADERRILRDAAADSVKRTLLMHAEEKIDWGSASHASLQAIAGLLEYKTVWHPVGA